MSIITSEQIKTMRTKVNTHPAKPILAEMMVTLQLAPGNKMNKEMMSEIELQLDNWEARLEEEEKKKEEEKKGKGFLIIKKNDGYGFLENGLC